MTVGLSTLKKCDSEHLLNLHSRFEFDIKNWQRRLEEVDFDDPHSIYQSRKEYEKRIRHLQKDIDTIDIVLAERDCGTQPA